MDTFYQAILTFSSMLLTVSITIVIARITFLKARMEKIKTEIDNYSHLLTQYRRLTYLALNHNCVDQKAYVHYRRNRKNVQLWKEESGEWSVYKAMEDIVGNPNADFLFNQQFEPSYLNDDIDKYSQNVNAIWFYLENKQNRCHAFTNKEVLSGDGMSPQEVAYLLKELSPINHYDSLNCESYANISGKMEINVLTSLGIHIREYVQFQQRHKMQSILILLGLLLIFGVILPLIGILFNVVFAYFYWTIFIGTIALLISLSLVVYSRIKNEIL